MQLLPCPSCTRRISREAQTCPKCGQPLADGWADEIEARLTAGRRKMLIAIVSIVGTIFVFNIIDHAMDQDTASYATYQPSPAPPQTVMLRRQDYGASWPFTVAEIKLGCESQLRGTIIRPEVYAIAGGKKYGLNGPAMEDEAHYLNGREITKKKYGAFMSTSEFIQRGLVMCGNS